VTPALLAASPVGRWPIYQLETGAPFDMSAWYNWVGAVGAVSWLVAYILVIVQGNKQATYGVPLIAICLILTWVLIYSICFTYLVSNWTSVDRTWFIADVLYARNNPMYARLLQS